MFNKFWFVVFFLQNSECQGVWSVLQPWRETKKYYWMNITEILYAIIYIIQYVNVYVLQWLHLHFVLLKVHLSSANGQLYFDIQYIRMYRAFRKYSDPFTLRGVTRNPMVTLAELQRLNTHWTKVQVSYIVSIVVMMLVKDRNTYDLHNTGNIMIM